MADIITSSFIRQGSCGSVGNIRTCLREGNAGSSSTCDIGGSGVGSNYKNTVPVRFDALPSAVSYAILTITYQQSGSDYWNAAQTITVRGCANFDSDTTGLNMPDIYETAITGSIAGGMDTTTINVTAAINEAISNGSKCLYIEANAADNRKRVKAITLTYEATQIIFNNESVQSININGQTGASVGFNGTVIY